MFTWLNDFELKSDKGFVVKTLSKSIMRYSEPLGYIDISFHDEMPEGRFFVCVYNDEFYKWNDGRKIAEEKKQEILQNFIDAMAFQDMGVMVRSGGPNEYDFVMLS